MLGSSQWMLALLIPQLGFSAWRFDCAIMNSRWRILITVIPSSKSVLGMVSSGMCHLDLNLVCRCLMWHNQSKSSSVFYLSTSQWYLNPIVAVTKVSPCPKAPKANAWCPACLCRNIVTRTMRLRLSTPAPVTWPTDAAQSWATPTWTDIHTPQQSPYAQMHHYTTPWCREVHIAAMYFHVRPTNQQERSVFWLVEWLSSCMQSKVLSTILTFAF